MWRSAGPVVPTGKEQVRIGVAASGIVTPVAMYRHRADSSRPASADDAEGKPRRAAVAHQPGDLMPVDAVGVDLGQRPGDRDE